jgi:CheY-like chemotaxis protein
MTTSESSRAAIGINSSQSDELRSSKLVVGGLATTGGRAAAEETPKLRVLVVDDSNTYRKQLCSWLEMKNLEVVGEAATGWEALELNEEFAPDVVLMDQNMPSLSGVDTTRRIKAEHPHTRIIFIAAEEAWRSEAFKAGADGYFVKGDDMSQLMTAIQHPAGVWQKPAGWPESRRGRRKWLWPLVGGLVALTVISVFVIFPSVLVPLLAFITGLISLIVGLK